MAEENMVVLAVHSYGGSQGFSPAFRDRPVYPLTGVKIRVYGPGIGWPVKAIGATPIMLDMSEIYESVKRGIVDGHVSGGAREITMGLREVCKWMWDRPIASISTTGAIDCTVINKDVWDEIGRANPEWQTIIREAWMEYQVEATIGSAGVEFGYYVGLLRDNKWLNFEPVPDWLEGELAKKVKDGDPEAGLEPPLLAWKARSMPSTVDMMMAVQRVVIDHYGQTVDDLYPGWVDEL